MWEKLFDLLIGWWDAVKLFEIIDQYEEGIILRWGRFNRIARSGKCWKWPIMEEILTEDIRTDTLNLSTQSLTTDDGVRVSVSLVIRFHISNVERYILKVKGDDGILGDMAMGIAEQMISDSEVDYVHTAELKAEIKEELIRQSSEFGFRVTNVNFADNSKANVIRLMND